MDSAIKVAADYLKACQWNISNLGCIEHIDQRLDFAIVLDIRQVVLVDARQDFAHGIDICDVGDRRAGQHISTVLLQEGVWQIGGWNVCDVDIQLH